ncbi:hypothetical protein [Methylobacterium thuringiense]|uniref:Uncharacterized protein n=1 Tax=Methylobacterium thuringiense TaxID=1003091 RepID=A0ABQ4TK90_9HYPH|nr:hypothetical protein [Methylobacterium thuringiense]GJE55023.1 hypothetical protein EKPJFOCH_1510 [Methylobacterium thuringiense]
MIAAQAMRCLPDLLAQRSQGFGSRNYAFSTTGETRLGFSQASAASGLDAPPVAMAIRSRVDALLASNRGQTVSHCEQSLLSVLVLLDMMTSNETRRLVLAGRDTPSLAAYGMSYDLDVRLLPSREGEACPAMDDEHTLLAVGLPLHTVAEHARNPWAVRGIVVSAIMDAEAARAFALQLPGAADEIATGVDFGEGELVAWLWPRL